ncbi:MAG: hypothetical protein ACYSSM_06130 [Planctomycetota bacterium]|jgi:hypothetical protein
MADDMRIKLKFVPKEDITAWELAQSCLWFNRGTIKTEEWPEGDSWTRHFETKPFNYSEYLRKSKEAFDNLDADFQNFLRT